VLEAKSGWPGCAFLDSYPLLAPLGCERQPWSILGSVTLYTAQHFVFGLLGSSFLPALSPFSKVSSGHSDMTGPPSEPIPDPNHSL